MALFCRISIWLTLPVQSETKVRKNLLPLIIQTHATQYWIAQVCDAYASALWNWADSGATGERLKEGALINQSLSTLSAIVRALSKQRVSEVLPFRDSRLTQLLQPSLGGNNRTAFICNVTLAQRFYDETRMTLAFAMQAKNVRNVPRINKVTNEKSLLHEANDEIKQLKRALEVAHENSDREREAGEQQKQVRCT